MHGHVLSRSLACPDLCAFGALEILLGDRGVGGVVAARDYRCRDGRRRGCDVVCHRGGDDGAVRHTHSVENPVPLLDPWVGR